MNLLNVGSKTARIILNGRIQKLLKSNGYPIKFGIVPGRGFVDTIFSLKSMIHSRCEHGIATFTVFIDLGKECKQARHEILSHVLLKIGAPPKHFEWIKNTYGDFSTFLKLNKEEIIIKYGCNVRQGDNFAPNVFIIVSQLNAENMLNKFKNNGGKISTILCNQIHMAMLKLHYCDDASLMINILINLIAHKDDGACVLITQMAQLKTARQFVK